jgi:hypothetical protein
MRRRPHRPSQRAYGPRRGRTAYASREHRRQPRKAPTENGKAPHLSATPTAVRSNGRRWDLPADETSPHNHPIAYDQASDVADGYAVVAKLYDRDTSSEEAHTAALIAIEGRLSLIAHSLRAIADNLGADESSGATNQRH